MTYWTDARTQDLKALWVEGLSASAIASRLGGKITRNAVISKVHRIGLPGRSTSSRKGGKNLSRRQSTALSKAMRSAGKAPLGLGDTKPRVVAPKPIDLKPKPLPPPRPEIVGRVTFQDLEPGMCKFPVGNEAPFMFCAAPAVEGKPYCSDCCRVAYSAPVVRPPRATLVPTFRQFERT